NVDRLRSVLFDAVAALPATEDRDCVCAHALDGVETGVVLP
ncbi:5'-methylthioadenosine phosphorylase, partial [Streptomyces halstedii]|nr:5'-methylthioadenosine phosphorylase [Streptomyces halstedii]